jgi:hypothetical protein
MCILERIFENETSDNFNQTWYKASMKGIQVYLNGVPSPLQRVDNHKSE